MKSKPFLLPLLAGIFILGVGVIEARSQGSPTNHAETSAIGQAVKRSEDHNKTSTHKVLRFGVHVSAMGKLDPHFAAGSQDRALADMVFNGLLRYQPGNAPKIEPDLAERIPEFEMVGGRQVWTVQLRKGVMFHPGPKTEAYELTAEDVVYSLQKSADKRYSAYAGEYTGMTVEQADAYTVRIILDKPSSPILLLPKLTNYAGGFIVSKKAIETMGYEHFLTHPIGTGPFQFMDYQPGKKLVLAAHDQYFRGRPLLEGIEFHFVPKIQAREAGLKTGVLDVIMGSGENGWIDKMMLSQDVLIDSHGVGEVATIYFNTRMKPFNDVRVRRAIAYALNREAFLNTTSNRLAGRVYSPVPAQFLPGGLEKKETEQLGVAYTTDLEKAKRLITEAGFPNGFSIEIVSSEKRLYRNQYKVLRNQLTQIGIQCRIKVVTHSRMHKLIRKEPKPIVIYIAWRPNADAFLSRFFHSDSIVVTGARPDTNFAHYDKIDRLIEAARLETNPKKQTNLWIQAQIRILNDMAAYPLMYTNQCYARRANVDYGHKLISTMALYPQFTEKTGFIEGR